MRTLSIWMNKDVITIGPEQTVMEACVLMKQYDIGALPVLENRKLVGIFTERDLLVKVAGDRKNYEQVLIKDVMTRQLLTGTPASDYEEIYRIMREKKIRHLPIVENGALVGILSTRDLFKFHTQILDQGLTDATNEVIFLKRLLNQAGDQRCEMLLRENEQLKSVVMVDSLTGLFNYRYFEVALITEISRATRHSHPVSLLFLDIDNFKQYNDINGHEAGNQVLKQFAELLRETSRTSDRLFKIRGIDIVARYGGEEFVMILPETSKDGGYGRAKRLLEDVRKTAFPHAESQPKGKLTISIGVAEFPADASTWGDLVRKADEALYQAKKNGRDQCV